MPQLPDRVAAGFGHLGSRRRREETRYLRFDYGRYPRRAQPPPPQADLCLRRAGLPRTPPKLLEGAETGLNENTGDARVKTCVSLLSLGKGERSILRAWEEAALSQWGSHPAR